MDKKDWLIITIIVALIVLVIIFWDKFIIRKEQIIAADYCQVDSDCVLAVNPHLCCIQPVPMNKKAVELDESFVVYEEGMNYSFYQKKGQCTDSQGKAIQGCAPLQLDINYSKSLICVNNKCTYNK